MFALHTGVWCGVGWIRAGGCFWGLGLAPYFQSVVLNRRNAQADALLHLTVSPGARLCGGSSHLHSVAALHPWTTVCVWVHACAWTENSGKCSLFWTLEIFSSLFFLLLSDFSVCFAPSCTLSILGQFIIRNWSCIFTGLWKTKYTPCLTSF